MPKQSTRLSPLDLQALPEFEDEYMQSPSVVAAHAGLHSPALKNPITGGMSSPMGHTCNFEDFSKHFHLPLKAAAEKFGVRATAFKKRCRAIGIRHWPYRKVRSLKRSLQELSRTQEQAAAEGIAGVSGGLTDKQQRQMTAYQKQLKTLLSPETYGIDPSGRLNVSAPFDDGENDMDDDDDDPDSDSPYSSPRSCFVEPDSSSNALRAAESQREFMMAMSNAPSHLRTFRRQTTYHSNQVPVQLSAAAYSAFYSGQTAANVSAASTGASSKIVFGWPDSYYFNEDLMGTMDTLSGAKATTPNAREQDGRDEQSSAPLIVPPAGSTASNDFLAADFRFEEVRQLRDGDHDGFTEPSGHIDYNSERFFDDVFLQISPDYGCLV